LQLVSIPNFNAEVWSKFECHIGRRIKRFCRRSAWLPDGLNSWKRQCVDNEGIIGSQGRRKKRFPAKPWVSAGTEAARNAAAQADNNTAIFCNEYW